MELHIGYSIPVATAIHTNEEFFDTPDQVHTLEVALFEADDTSFKLPLTVNYITVPAILYTGAGVSIITYDDWMKWGSLEMVQLPILLLMVSLGTMKSWRCQTTSTKWPLLLN